MSALTDGWLTDYGFAYVPNPRSGGSTYDPEGEGYPWRLTWHTIEGRRIPDTSTHASPPHVWVDPETGTKIQTVPLTRGAFALWQGAWAPYYTNRARALQVEITGYAEEAPSWSDERLRWLANEVAVPLCAFVEAAGGRIDFSDPATPLAGAIPGSAREDAAQRLDPTVWAFGPVGNTWHRHVPMGDNHWDAPVDNRRFRDHIVAAVGGPGFPAPVPTEPTRRTLDMPEGKLRRDPATGEPLVFPWEGFGHGVVAYDLPLAPVGSTIGVGFKPEWGTPPGERVNAAATSNGKDVADRAAFGPGSPALFPIKGTREVAVLVHAVESVLPASERGRGWDARDRVNVVAV